MVATPNPTGPFVVSPAMVPGGDVAGSSVPRAKDVQWASAGRRIFFIADAVSDGRPELWAVALHNGVRVEHVSADGASNPQVTEMELSRDGRRIAYHRGRVSRDMTGPSLGAHLDLDSVLGGAGGFNGIRYLRTGRVAALYGDSGYLVDLSAGSSTRFAGPLASTQRYIWIVPTP